MGERGRRASGALLDFLTSTAGIDFPVDEWLYGVARVRPLLARLGDPRCCSPAPSGAPSRRLLPIQLPFAAGAPWLALQFPPDYVLDSDRLLYTAHYATPFDATARQCGLLLDEWTEVIPGTTRDTGIAFHFDRPDNEPPQAILLVTPASASGTWQWDDLVGALQRDARPGEEARRRAGPRRRDAPTPRFLPATIMAATLYGISITTTLAAANGVLRTGGGDSDA